MKLPEEQQKIYDNFIEEMNDIEDSLKIQRRDYDELMRRTNVIIDGITGGSSDDFLKEQSSNR